MKRFLNFLICAAILGVAFAPGASACAEMLDLNPALVAGGVVLAAATVSYFTHTNVIGGFTAGLNKELWTRDIVGNLYKDNQFALRRYNEDEYVLDGAVVHNANAGAPSDVTKNQTTFPVAAVRRADTDNTYPLDTYYSAPRHILQIEKYELSYDKRQSCLGEDQAKLIQDSMYGLIYRWSPAAANVVLTTGGTGAAFTGATAAGGTGNRFIFEKSIFSTIKLKMDLADIPSAGRVALLTANHLQQLLDSLSDAEKTNFNALADMKNGIISRYMGFDIMMRSSVTRYRKVSSVWTVIDEQDPAFAASTKTGDSSASLFWHEMAVKGAKGSVEIFDNPNRAEYYGDIYSMLMRLGGRIRRAAGVYAVVEDIAP